jgi:hypothetical protein
MGCGKSRSAPAYVEEIPVQDLEKLDRFSRFEHNFPFYRIRIDIFEGKVKRFVVGKTSVSLNQLRYAFKDDKNWSDLNDDDSLLVKILKSDYFRDPKNKDEINIHALILWGLILCPGDNELKSRVFYDVLQDNLQPMISASDKEFPDSFRTLIELATKLVYEYEPQVNSGETPVDPEKVTDEVIDNLREQFLDGIFGHASKMPRKEYMDAVAKKDNVNYIFNSKDIRQRVDKEISA